jgi:hypothetical protein
VPEFADGGKQPELSKSGNSGVARDPALRHHAAGLYEHKVENGEPRKTSGEHDR